tara:strand:- start:28601 stop:29236 length:636 start_codon:yes stop_codon:yes gene_type:complete
MTELGSNISYWTGIYEPGVWTVDRKLIDKQTDDRTGVGYLLAQAISFPSEEFGVSTEPVPGSGGFVSGYVGDRRSDYGSSNKIDISFLETNRDIIDFFIRPWIVACSYKGLIEDDEAPIKCNIVATLYSRASKYYKDKAISSQNPTRPHVEYKARKQLTFKDCVPTNIEADKISYNDLSFDELVKTASFIFSHYTINDITNGVSVEESRGG